VSVTSAVKRDILHENVHLVDQDVEVLVVVAAVLLVQVMTSF